MGDPRKLRRRFLRPGHPWQKERIEDEKKLLKHYGLKNKTEIWKTVSQLRTFSNQAKKLIATNNTQANREKTQLLQKLHRHGLIKADAKLDDVLGITLQQILQRRLQTILVTKGIAKTMNQSRQFITHEHVLIHGKKLTRPSHLVLLDEEDKISFAPTSPLNTTDHPARTIQEHKK